MGGREGGGGGGGIYPPNPKFSPYTVYPEILAVFKFGGLAPN